MTATKGLPARRPDRGSVLVVALVAIVVMTGISMAYFSTSLSQSNRSFQDSLVVKATYVATCGINSVIVDLNESRNGNLDGNAYYPKTISNRDNGVILFPGAPTPEPLLKPTDVPYFDTYNLSANKLLTIAIRPSGDFTTTSTLNADGTYTVTSSGVFDRKVVTIESVLKKNPTTSLVFAAFGKNGVTCNGSIFTDSYDSQNGTYASQAVNVNNNKGNNDTYAGVKGSLGSNGSIVTHGAANAIFGDVTCGPADTFTPSGYVHGSTAPATSLRAVPDYSYVLPSSYTNLANYSGGSLGTGTYRATSITGSFTVVAGATVKMYLDGSISYTGKKGITIAAGGTLELYCGPSSDVKLAGMGVINNNDKPSNFKLYSASTNGTDLTGNSILYGVVYAPQSDVKMSGNAQVYGAVVGNTITLSGGGTRGGFHYDEALSEGVGTVTKYSIQSMRTALTQSY